MYFSEMKTKLYFTILVFLFNFQLSFTQIKIDNNHPDIDYLSLNRIGDISFIKKDHRFRLNFTVLKDFGKTVNTKSIGYQYCEGIFFSRFWVDPREKLIGITMVLELPFSRRDTIKKPAYRQAGSKRSLIIL